MTTQTLYETDFNLWIEQTVNQLKQGQLQDLDIENLIEEVESLGLKDKREIRSRLRVLLIHLLKWKYQPFEQITNWISTINEQRFQIELILEDSPSLIPYLQEHLAKCYQQAREDVQIETDLSIQIFPVDCPFTQEQILDSDYFPQ